MTSIHEAGHTLMCYKSKFCKDRLHQVTIIPRGPAEGVTMMLYDEDAVDSREEMLSSIDVAMGGHIAEEIVFGKDRITAGCSSDLSKATQVATAMVKKYGMYADEIGYTYVKNENPYEDERVSEQTKEKIDFTVNKILKESYVRVKDEFTNNYQTLVNLGQTLYRKDTLNCCFLTRR